MTPKKEKGWRIIKTTIWAGLTIGVLVSGASSISIMLFAGFSGLLQVMNMIGDEKYEN